GSSPVKMMKTGVLPEWSAGIYLILSPIRLPVPSSRLRQPCLDCISFLLNHERCCQAAWIVAIHAICSLGFSIDQHEFENILIPEGQRISVASGGRYQGAG